MARLTADMIDPYICWLVSRMCSMSVVCVTRSAHVLSIARMTRAVSAPSQYT